jgi:hypothetical protein
MDVINGINYPFDCKCKHTMIGKYKRQAVILGEVMCMIARLAKGPLRTNVSICRALLNVSIELVS